MVVFRWWHNLLDMKRKDEKWHKDDITDELAEYDEATGLIHRWSELSDVVYTVTRSRWSGYKLSSPLSKRQFFIGSFYMFPKYSFRWLFFYRAGRKAGAKYKVTEVRNPKKTEKLKIIAKRNSIDPDTFINICQKQLRYWPLLK